MQIALKTRMHKKIVKIIMYLYVPYVMLSLSGVLNAPDTPSAGKTQTVLTISSATLSDAGEIMIPPPFFL